MIREHIYTTITLRNYISCFFFVRSWNMLLKTLVINCPSSSEHCTSVMKRNNKKSEQESA